ncbi:uncharacterized protein LOC119666485 [Teleopsis dalmanni]|uniref:uncharacterized protein LOC119666485 n=1 Tax=Teleopsis dalmanni TaxID=139649 RepID=UPI0018CFD249|nr:uncharacterized protein LOC119666485 [Teleopsis dalmanni]
MCTKAIHLEAVSDLSSEAFIAALKRFFPRRGKSAHLYSDNGTNFIGALKKLDKEFGNAIKNNTSMLPILAAEKIEWHFIPPASPHFGGIWEAAVKSVKYHLKRVIGETKLTFEEMTTLLNQIEAVLNSRPLCYTSSDIDSIDVLTPGHFLIGRPILDEPETEVKNNISLIDRSKLVQKIKTDFWKKWKNEYVTSLQKRNKWFREKPNLAEGQVVIIKDENTAPTRWPLGKITEVFKDINDGNKLFIWSVRERRKRAPLAFIGSFYHLLFGMMDEDDRKALEEDMNNLLENQHNLKKMTERQTSVVETTVNILKRTSEELQQQYNEIHERVESINTALNETYLVYKESINFFMVARQLSDMIEECSQIQSEVMELLMGVNHGKLNPALIKPSQLHREIIKIRDIIPENQMLPGKKLERS